MMKFLLKILKLFRKQNMEVKVAILYLISSLLFFTSFMLTLSPVILSLYGVAMVLFTPYACLTTFTDKKHPGLNRLLDKLINKVGQHIKSKEKEVLPIKNLEELTEGSIIRDYSAMPEVPRLNTEGSIIRSLEEIEEEKTGYVSLLAYVKMYQALEGRKQEKSDEPAPVVESNGFSKSIGGF